MNTIALLLTLLPIGAMSVPTRHPHYPIQQFQLRNGLHVVLSPDHTTPVAALALAYDVGSRSEQRGHTGFAHLFEHLMFQGSAHVGKFEHARLIESNGGVMNGFTRVEDTTYIEIAPAEKLPLLLWLEADRMRSLNVSAENLTNQRQVVEEEKRLRYDNQPYVNERAVLLPDLAFSNFAYQHSTIGSMADLDAASLQDVREFHDGYYVPNNATLVLVGDFQPAMARLLLNDLFGSIPRKPQPPVPDLREPTQTGERRESVTDPLARMPAVVMAWRGPSITNPDTDAVVLMNELLFGGETSRAYQHLVRQRRLALSVQGGLDSHRGPSLSTVFALFPPNVVERDLEQAITDEIKTLQQMPPSREELERVKTAYEAQQYRGGVISGLESPLGRAVSIADAAVFEGDPDRVNTDIDRLVAVTPDQIQAVARKYFQPSDTTVIVIRPGAGRGGRS